MFGITDPVTFVLGTIFIILLPGPNSLYVLSVATRHGVRAGMGGACGIFLGDTLLMLFTAVGAASLLRSAPALFTVLKYAGAAYLSWVGLTMLYRSAQFWLGAVPAPLAPPSQAENMRQPFMRALVISLINPKAILFFVSFLVQFVDPSYAHPWLTFVLLGGIVQLFSALYLTLIIFMGTRLAEHFRARHRLSAALNAAVGMMFVGFGARLAIATLE